MLKKGERIELQITSMGSSGEGVGKLDGFAIFVPGALVGEIVKVQITLVKKSYATGRLVQVVVKSSQRQKPLCEVFYKCGGCQLQHLTYEGQLAIKRQQVQDALERIGHFKNIEVQPVLADPKPLYYRNKMLCPIASQDGLKIGFYKNATHEIVDIKKCYIQSEANNQILNAIRNWIHKYKVSIYNEQSGKGLLRHILGRVSASTGEVMVGLVCTQKSLPNKEELIETLRMNIPNLASVIQNINSYRTNVVLGEHTRVLYGKPAIADKIGNFEFNISAASFFQVNTAQANVLYQTALEFADLSGQEHVIDLYCGIGTISLFLAKKAKMVWGIELSSVAVENAKENAMRNQIGNVEFNCADATVAMAKLAKKKNIEVIVLDPPRAGCDKQVLEHILQIAPKKIVYVSCNPASLARDMRILADSGEYELAKVQPVDMFAQTSHVECVALMSRVQK